MAKMAHPFLWTWDVPPASSQRRSRTLSRNADAADRNLPELRYGMLRLDRGLIENRTNQYPDIPDEHPEAGEDEKLGELSAVNV